MAFINFNRSDYPKLRHPRYGTANPEKVENPLWEFAIKKSLAGYTVRQQFGGEPGESGASQTSCQNPAVAAYREEPGPHWSWERFGRTTTLLPDGRKVHVAGEYEDFYDPDFCIYNDVIVENPDGSFEFYLYPKHVFPPTDFHTATLIGDDILLIGSLGYMDMREPGKTQLLRLSTKTFKIEPIEAIGDSPGWISSHHAEEAADNNILIYGGEILGADGKFHDNTKQFLLNTDHWTWQPVAPGDQRFFPVSLEDYQSGKFARFGKTNPEKIDNPFWLEMARRNWTPSRARQHFDDPIKGKTRDKPSRDLKCPYEEGTSIWTIERVHTATITLSDNRQVKIGGEVLHFGDEAADAWMYNDIVVTNPSGEVEIYAYPPGDFPLMIDIGAIEYEGDLIIFGRQWPVKRANHIPSAYAINLRTFEIRLLDSVTSDLIPFTGQPVREGETLYFTHRKRSSDEPTYPISFDLKEFCWQILPARTKEK